jgi:hypothetical protein
VVAGVDHGGDGEPAAGGFAREGDVRRGGAVVEEGLVGGEGVVDRGGGDGDVGGQRLGGYQLAEQPPLLADADVGGEG